MLGGKSAVLLFAFLGICNASIGIIAVQNLQKDYECCEGNPSSLSATMMARVTKDALSPMLPHTNDEQLCPSDYSHLVIEWPGVLRLGNLGPKLPGLPL